MINYINVLINIVIIKEFCLITASFTFAADLVSPPQAED